jgi:antitoxin component of MazEF toxin-antitoxin module
MPRNHSSLSFSSRLEDGSAVKIPHEVLSQAGFNPGDAVFLRIEDTNIIISKTDSPEEGSLESLFKDYACGSFQTELLDLGDPVGEEKW